MPNPLTRFLARCNRGFTPAQKTMLSVFLVVYIVSPIDLLPLLPIDDLGAMWALFRVLASSTVRPSKAAPSTPATALQPRT